MGSLTPSAVKTFREKGARFIHALTCEEDMGKRKVKNSLPPAALEKKAQSKRTLLNTAKDRPERRSFLYGRSEVIRTPGILLPNLCLNLQQDLLRPLWRFPALLRFLFGTLLPCSFQTPLSSFGICVGLNSVY